MCHNMLLKKTDLCLLLVSTSNIYGVVLLTTSSSLYDREEWEWLQSHVYTANGSAQNLLGAEEESLIENDRLEFIRSLRAAVTHLLTKLNIPLYRVSLVSDT